MLSPSPTQHPPDAPKSDQKPVKSTPVRRRVGQSPGAILVKSIFRPVFKSLYYLIQTVRGHRLLSLGAVVLLLAGIFVTNFLATGLWPFGIGNDQFNFHIHGTNGGGGQVKNWVYHLREGNVAAMVIDEKNMSQPPDPTQLIGQYSEAKTNLTWKSINVIGVYSEPDGTIDSFVEIDTVAHGPGGDTKGIMIWHFVTVAQNGGILISVDLVGGQIRPSLQ